MNESVPEACKAALDKSFETSTELLLELDSIALSYGFKIKKSNGDKNYIYLKCSKSGQPAPDKPNKSTNKKSDKTSKFFIPV